MPAFVDLMRAAGVAVVFADSEKYPEFFDVTADFVYLRLESAQARDRDRLSGGRHRRCGRKRIATWAQGGVPDDLAVHREEAAAEDAARLLRLCDQRRQGARAGRGDGASVRACLKA